GDVYVEIARAHGGIEFSESLQIQQYLLQATFGQGIERRQRLGAGLAIGIEAVASLELPQRRGQPIVKIIWPGPKLSQIAGRKQALLENRNARIRHPLFELWATRNGRPIARRRIAPVDRQRMAQPPIEEIRWKMIGHESA